MQVQYETCPGWRFLPRRAIAKHMPMIEMSTDADLRLLEENDVVTVVALEEKRAGEQASAVQFAGLVGVVTPRFAFIASDEVTEIGIRRGQVLPVPIGCIASIADHIGTPA